MAKIVALFNHKGGVSKTTTCFNLGWALADRGHRVLLVDADPQCNLTGMALELSGQSDLTEFYKKKPSSNLYNALEPAFSGTPKALKPATPASTRHKNVLLLAGHIDVAGYEPELSMAHRLTEAMPVLQNLPGAAGHLIRATADKIEAEFVLVDMSPSVGALNQNLLMQADYFMVPTSPDYFCAMAIDSLAKTLPLWHSTGENLRRIQRRLTYKLPERSPKFIGMLSQRYRPRSGRPALAFQEWIDEIVTRVNQRLVPALSTVGMTLSARQFADATGDTNFEISQVADFNSLIAHSQEFATPVFALTDSQLKSQGKILTQKRKARQEFKTTFDEMAARVESLCT
jgi:chromosome partitioning protein